MPILYGFKQNSCIEIWAIILKIYPWETKMLIVRQRQYPLTLHKMCSFL